MKSPAAPGSQSELHPGSGTDLDLAEIYAVWRRRQSLFWKSLLACAVLGVIFLALSKSRYRADAELQVLSADPAAGLTGASSDDAGSALQLSLTMQTYVGLLESDNLALRVIREQKLEEVHEFETSTALRKAPGEASAPLDQTRFRREEVLRKFRRDLQVSIISGSRLINVGFASTDPDVAKRVLNQLLKDFVEYNYEVRYNASAATEDWLGKQLVDLKAQVQRSQEEAARLQRETGVYGMDGAHNLVVSRLEALDQELVAAQQNRIVKGAVLHVVDAGDPEAISNLSSTAGQSTSPGSVNSLALVQTLRQQEAVIATQYADLASKYGTNYPRLIALKDQIESLNASIKHENGRLSARAKNDYQAALEQENQLKQQVSLQKDQAERANDLSVRYLIANREATSSRDLYEHLLERLKEAGILSGLHSTNIDVIDAPHVGAAPTQPKVAEILGIALVAGVLLGLCLIFLADNMDHSIHKANDLRELGSGALLGVLPRVGTSGLRNAAKSEELPSNKSDRPDVLIRSLANEDLARPEASLMEALRQVRTALECSSMQPTLPGSECPVIMATSAQRGDGKSAVTAGLAGVLAQQGRSVLLIDADLRRAALSRDLGLAGETGLSDLLERSTSYAEVKSHIRHVGKIDVLPAGSIRANPSELLSSLGAAALLAAARADYDFVLVDTVPILGVTDAVALASHVDGVILVARAGATRRQSLAQAMQLLRNVNAPILGSVFNGVDQRSGEYAFLYEVQAATA